MQITANTTPHLAELFVPTDKHGRRRCVVVIKATFTVRPEDGRAVPAEEQAPFVYADQHHGDPGTTSIRYECDFVPVKPRAEVLVNASAVAPEGRAVRQLEVGFAGPGIAKRAVVTGDRVWVEGANGIQPSSPQPFTTVPLVYERAFGGSDHSHERTFMNGTELRNPVGVGFHLNGARETILGLPLPNVERPEARQTSWSDKPEPVGFAGLGRGWRPRIGFAGTYDQHWLDDVFPFLPEDFDDRYFQAAPADQQLEALSPGARFGCLNMSEGGRFVAELPELAVPVRFHFDDRTESATARPTRSSSSPTGPASSCSHAPASRSAASSRPCARSRSAGPSAPSRPTSRCTTASPSCLRPSGGGTEAWPTSSSRPAAAFPSLRSLPPRFCPPGQAATAQTRDNRGSVL